MVARKVQKREETKKSWQNSAWLSNSLFPLSPQPAGKICVRRSSCLAKLV